MHIPEGLIPAGQAAAWYAPALAFVGTGLAGIKRRFALAPETKPLVGLMGAFVFVVSLMPVPVPGLGTVSHPCGTPLAAILLGPFTAAVLGSVALLLQALFFAHGGLTTWGANIFSMAICGSFSGYAAFRLARRLGLGLGFAAGLAGVTGDLVTYAVTSLQLALSLHGHESVGVAWAATFASFLPTQVPLALAEALFSAGVVVFISRQRMEILDGNGIRPQGSAAARIWPVMLTMGTILGAGVFALKMGWQGTDDTVIAPMAGDGAAMGAKLLPWQPEGDSLLLALALGGAAGILVFGYFWRRFRSSRPAQKSLARESSSKHSHADSYAWGGSFLSRIDPRVKLAAVAGLLAVNLFRGSALVSAAIAGFMFLLMLAGRIPYRRQLLMIAFPVTFAVFIIISQTLFEGGSVFTSIGPLDLTWRRTASRPLPLGACGCRRP